LALVTEWKPFRHPDLNAMKKLMKLPIIFDGRNQYDPKQMRTEGFEYFGIGRGSSQPAHQVSVKPSLVKEALAR
jgi:UDPglucose 6-dehydrogenase